jgi:hypothetical protein
MKFKKIVLRKTSDQPAEVMYEDNRGKQYKELTNDDFNQLLEKLNFNNDFALPDKLVQDFVNDGSIMPSFKRSLFFNYADMEDLVKNIKPYRKKRRLQQKTTTKKKKKHSTKKRKTSKK